MPPSADEGLGGRPDGLDRLGDGVPEPVVEGPEAGLDEVRVDGRTGAGYGGGPDPQEGVHLRLWVSGVGEDADDGAIVLDEVVEDDVAGADDDGRRGLVECGHSHGDAHFLPVHRVIGETEAGG